MKEQEIEKLFKMYIESHHYRTTPTLTEIKAIDIKLEQELTKLNITSEQKEDIADISYQYVTAGELQGFIHGFRYAISIMKDVIGKNEK